MNKPHKALGTEERRLAMELCVQMGEVTPSYYIVNLLKDVEALEGELRAYRQSGAREALHAICHAFSTTRESDEAEHDAIRDAYDKARAAVAKLEAL